jgi:hypothetical protein
LIARAARLLGFALFVFIAIVAIAGSIAPFVEWPFRPIVAGALMGASAAILVLSIGAMAAEIVGRES